MKCLTFAGETDIAYLGGYSGTVFRTDAGVLFDGDLSWVGAQLPDTDHPVLGLAFLDADTGYAVTGGMKAWWTTTGGANWAEVAISSPPSTQALNAVATFGDGSRAIAAGAAGLVLVRNGTRFQVVDLSGLIGATQLNDVAILGGGTRIVVAGNDGLIVGWAGSDFADALVPSNWFVPKSMTETSIVAVSFDAVDHGFAIGQQGLVVEYD